MESGPCPKCGKPTTIRGYIVSEPEGHGGFAPQHCRLFQRGLVVPNRTVRLLQRAIEVPGLSLGLAPLLVEYHIHRDEVARRSDTRTWWARHEKVKLLPL